MAGGYLIFRHDNKNRIKQEKRKRKMKEKKDANRKPQLQSMVRSVKTILFAVLMCVCMNYTESRAAEILYSGTSGDLDWSIDSEGLSQLVEPVIMSWMV